MKASISVCIFAALLTPIVSAQKQPCTDAPPQVDIHISSGVAEKLLIHKVSVACPHSDMAARIIATVVVVILIDKNGNVQYPRIVSGPALLKKATLDAVRKYKYRPYLLNGEAVEVETTVSVNVDTLGNCPAN